MVKKIGIIFADEMEYLPFEQYATPLGAVKTTKRSNEALVLNVKKGDREIEIHAVKCGIGKVNSASAASFLISDDNVSAVLNAGLSGGVKGVRREDFVAGSSYVECDFDLTALGLPIGQKPGQDYIYNADETLLRLVLMSDGIHSGRLGTGDLFLTDKEKKDLFDGLFDLTAFDMETAAIASVCHKADIPFVSVRKISDDADAEGAEAYREMNERAESSLTEVLASVIDRMFDEESYWS